MTLKTSSFLVLLIACGGGEVLPVESPKAAPQAEAPSVASATLVAASALPPAALPPASVATMTPLVSVTPASTTPPGLQIEDIKVGTGMVVASGDRAKLHYTGTLENGTVFDTSLKAGREPFVFRVGKGQVIKGWDEGIVGMRIGGKRKLKIAPELGYGAKGAGPTIPPNATLFFEVELLDVVKFGP
jgi:FKBP-type peptidyl-prolyl cis-trans isomerase